MPTTPTSCNAALQDLGTEQLAALQLKAAFDPAGTLNPGKQIPTLHRCAEYGRMHVKRGLLAFPELERF